MIQWHPEPLWSFYWRQGIDPETMTPRPMEGPIPLSPEQWRWQLEKQRNRLAKTVAQAESGRQQPRAFQDKEVWRALNRAKALLRYK